MAIPVYFSSFAIPLWILAVLGFLLAFTITYIAIPSIVTVAQIKGLCAIPNGRTSHKNPVPTLGGVSIFAGFILATILVGGTYFNSELIFIISGLIIIFFVGIKDDILVIDAWKKLLGQILAVFIIAVLANIRINNLHELLNIGDIPYIVSIIITVFVFIVIINGFNLIDGIDGLAAGVGILTSSILGIWFFMAENFAYTTLCFAFTGTLVAFFRFNVFSKRYKIFLGDTGSLIVGLVMSILIIRFLQLDLTVEKELAIQSAPAFAIGILIIPLFDTLRIFILRINQGKSPFTADRQHLHHDLLRLGMTHLQATLVLLSVNLVFIALCYFLQGIGNLWLMVIILGIASLLSRFLVIYGRKRIKKILDDEYITVERYKVAHKMKKLLTAKSETNVFVIKKETSKTSNLTNREHYNILERDIAVEVENKAAENLFRHRFKIGEMI